MKKFFLLLTIVLLGSTMTMVAQDDELCITLTSQESLQEQSILDISTPTNQGDKELVEQLITTESDSIRTLTLTELSSRHISCALFATMEQGGVIDLYIDALFAQLEIPFSQSTANSFAHLIGIWNNYCGLQESPYATEEFAGRIWKTARNYELTYAPQGTGGYTHTRYEFILMLFHSIGYESVKSQILQDFMSFREEVRVHLYEDILETGILTYQQRQQLVENVLSQSHLSGSEYVTLMKLLPTHRQQLFEKARSVQGCFTDHDAINVLSMQNVLQPNQAWYEICDAFYNVLRELDYQFGEPVLRQLAFNAALSDELRRQIYDPSLLYEMGWEDTYNLAVAIVRNPESAMTLDIVNDLFTLYRNDTREGEYNDLGTVYWQILRLHTERQFTFISSNGSRQISDRKAYSKSSSWNIHQANSFYKAKYLRKGKYEAHEKLFWEAVTTATRN